MQTNWSFKPAISPAACEHVRPLGSVTAMVPTVLPMPNVVRPVPAIISPGNDDEGADRSGTGEAVLDHVSLQVISRVHEAGSRPRDAAMLRLRAYRRAAGRKPDQADESQADLEV